MKRLRLILGMVAAMVLMMVVAAPSAMADDFDNGFLVFDGNGFGDIEFGDVESGDITQTTRISSSGDNTNQSATVLNAANTGNVVNQQGFGLGGFDNGFDNGFDDGFFILDDDFDDFDDGFFIVGDDFDDFNGFDDLEFEGSSIEVNPSLTSDTNQVIEQTAVAGSWW